METINIDKKVFAEIARQVEELSLKIESLELSSDPELMKSLKKSEKQINNGDVIEFNDL